MRTLIINKANTYFLTVYGQRDVALPAQFNTFLEESVSLVKDLLAWEPQYLSNQAQKSTLFPHPISFFSRRFSDKLLLFPSLQSLSNTFLLWPLSPPSAAAMLKVKDDFHVPSWKPDSTASFICQEDLGRKSSVLKLWDQEHLTDRTYVRFGCQTDMSLLTRHDFFFRYF